MKAIDDVYDGQHIQVEESIVQFCLYTFIRMSNRVICGDIKATTKQTLGTRTKAQVKYKNAKTDNLNEKKRECFSNVS